MNTSKDNKPSAWDILNRLGSALNIVTAIAVIFMAVQFNGLHTSLLNYFNGLETSTSTSTSNPVGGTALTGSAKSEAIDKLTTYIKNLKYSNAYLVLSEGDTDMVMLTNEHGESAVDGDSKIIYLNDGNTYTFADEVYYGMDTDVLTTLTLAVKAASNGYADMRVIDTSETHEGTEEYLVDIHGYDNILRMYEQFDSTFANDVVTALKTQLDSSSDLENVDKDNIHLRYALITFDESLYAGGCYFYFGDEEVGEDWGNCYGSWTFEGWAEIGEWKLADDWYNIDIENVDEAEIQTTLQTLLVTYYAEMTEILNESGLYEGSTSTEPESSEVTEPESNADYEATTSIETGDSDTSNSEESHDHDHSTETTE